MKRIVPIAFTLLALLASCTKEEIPQENLSNREVMNRLNISDPMIWNSMVTQFIDTDSLDGGLKAGNNNVKYGEYPSSKEYYYALFEDLYPYQGDYDFNDVVLETKLFLGSSKGNLLGYTQSKVFNRGGTLKTRIGLMFYSFDGKKTYTRIPNNQLQINGVNIDGTDPFTMELPKEGTDFKIDFMIMKGKVSVKYIWIHYFLMVESGGEMREIHPSGFAPSELEQFEIPHRQYLTDSNLPWGLEIVAEEFFVPTEKTLILEAFPEFREWAQSNGSKNTSWFRNPDRKKVK